jgi:hypothetical protein
VRRGRIHRVPALGSRADPSRGARRSVSGCSTCRACTASPQRHTRPGDPGGWCVPSREAGQHETRRVPAGVQNETVGPPGPQRRRALSGPAAADQEPRAPSTTVATPSCGAWSTDRLRVPPLRALPHPGLAPRRQAQLGEIPHRYSPLQSDEPCCRSRWFVAVTVGVWVWSHTRLLVGAVMCTVR